MTSNAGDTQELDARRAARTLFGNPDDTPVLPPPKPPGSLLIAREGNSPTPGPISDEVAMRDLTRRMFDDDYAATQQPLPEE